MDKIKDQLINKTKKERATIKAQELSKEKLPTTFIIRGIEVNIKKQPVYEKDSVRIELEAKKNNIDLVLDNPFYFYNPPIMVALNTTHQVYDEPTEKYVDVPNYEENAQRALKENIVQTLEALYGNI